MNFIFITVSMMLFITVFMMLFITDFMMLFITVFMMPFITDFMMLCCSLYSILFVLSRRFSGIFRQEKTSMPTVRQLSANFARAFDFGRRL